MLFNSLDFLIFLITVFSLYWLAGGNTKLQNRILFVAGYVFYGAWDYRFLFLLLFSTFLDYYSALRIARVDNAKARRNWLILSVGANIGLLGFFKYYNFFIESSMSLINTIGLQPNVWTLKIILPLGISFYTFHGLSYVFDVYNRKVAPTRDYLDYSVYVCFFPLLVAGPIERATHLLPQIKQARTFEYSKAADGARQILWGFFKKIVIADKCAEYVNLFFENPDRYNGSALLLGAILFSFQIYADFSGYSDIALGTARLFGFELLKNFSYPYFSRDIAEFWRRWHISLTSWFRDYLYYPLGGNKGSKWKTVRNTFIVFLVSGLWHGANWTFIVWGALNALVFIPLLLRNRNRQHIEIVAQGRTWPGAVESLQIAGTFLLVTFLWIFFRSNSLPDAVHYISLIVSPSLFSVPTLVPYTTLIVIPFFILVEWLGREHSYAIENIEKRNKMVRWTFYYLLTIAILYYSGREQTFIYFQF